MKENKFSQNLKNLRQLYKLSQDELGAKINVSKQTISKYEKGLADPNFHTLIEIAKSFDCSLDELVFGNVDTISKSPIGLNLIVENKINDLKNELAVVINSYFEYSDSMEFSNDLIIPPKMSAIINIDDYSKSEKTYIDIGFYKENDVQIYYPKESKENTYRIPVVGYISAGCPHWAFENISNHLNISKDYLGCYNKYFILKVAGESMNEIYKNNDYILVDGSQNIVSSNTPVIALVDNDEATVKYIYIDHENNTFTLIPKSSDNTFEPITYSFERHSLKILGTVLGVVNYANSIK